LSALFSIRRALPRRGSLASTRYKGKSGAGLQEMFKEFSKEKMEWSKSGARAEPWSSGLLD
jgi:hypothetical protein